MPPYHWKVHCETICCLCDKMDFFASFYRIGELAKYTLAFNKVF